MKQGDVFAVPISDRGGVATLFSACGKDVTEQVVFLKVTELSPEWQTSLMIDSAKTRVSLEGVCRSALPSNAIGFLQSSKLGESKPLPDGLLKQVEEGNEEFPKVWQNIASILAPLLHKTARSVTLNTAALLEGPPGSDQIKAASTAAAALGVHLIVYSCEELRGPSDLKTAAALKAALEAAADFAPSLLVLQNLPALIDGHNPTGSSGSNNVRVAAAMTECLNALCDAGGQDTVLVLGTANLASDVAPSLRRCFTHELKSGAPDLAQRSTILSALLSDSLPIGERCLQSTALKTAGFLPAELSALAADAAAIAISSLATAADADHCNGSLRQNTDWCRDCELNLPAGRHADKAEEASNDPMQDQVADLESQIKDSDLEAALEGIRARTAANMGAPQVPNVKWEDVGGLEEIKEAILETIELPLKHPELFHSGLRRRSGLLLYGPPGTGKTLVAKAVATECNINFLSVKGPELINMYIGESERQVREVFERARRARPCVLFFDELDSLAPARGAGADSGGVMDRVVSQLLAEVDNLQSCASGGRSSTASSQDIFLIGATNRPDLLDSSLMRPGRLDKLLYVGIAQHKEDKMKVLQALTRKFTLAPSVNLDVIAQGCATTLTGADLYALCADAWMVGLRRTTAAKEDAKHWDTVTVEQGDFHKALGSLTPSLSQDELARYAALRNKFLSL